MTPWHLALLTVPFVSLFVSVSSHAGDPKQEKFWNFDKDEIGKLPSGWSIQQTRLDKPAAVWNVIADQTAPSKPNVLSLTRAAQEEGAFNLAVADGTSFKDFDMTVKVKAVAGEEDQGGGLIWRCKDRNNYYLCRFNPLESNYRVYKVVDGARKQLQSVSVETRAEKWYEVRVTMVGDRITCRLDGRQWLEAQDSTFADAGMIGLWTKADAQSSFDDLRVTSDLGKVEPQAPGSPNPGKPGP